MEAFIHELATFIKEHQAFAGPIIGLICFGESLVVIGILLPGTAVLVVVGGFIGSGLLSPWPILIAAVIGAALGDTVSYYLGPLFGRQIFYQWPLNTQRRSVARARLFFQRWGLAAVFLGRFFGPVRSFVPFLAGLMAMDVRRFQIANIGSALVWAPVVLSPGWLVAKSTRYWISLGEADRIGLLAAAIGAVAAVAVAAYVLMKRSQSRKRAANGKRRVPAKT
ncbi:MAG TPA: DedA family protein [Bauldia sp.]|nr:DedA family protein [Bauldia sp.]